MCVCVCLCVYSHKYIVGTASPVSCQGSSLVIARWAKISVKVRWCLGPLALENDSKREELLQYFYFSMLYFVLDTVSRMLYFVKIK